MSDTYPAIGLVSTDWLDARRGQPGLAIVDGSWHLPPTGRSGPAEYAEAHLPGAVFFDIDRISDPTSGLPHMLPTPEAFAAAVGAMGIDGEGTIVVYDQLGLFTAARVAWMFVIYGAKDVRILEGGLPRWRAEGRPVTAELPSPSPVRFAARMTSGAVADLDAVQRALATGSVQVVDARPAPRFNGAAPEPRPGVRAGHMPGSLNLPFDRVVADGALRGAGGRPS